MTSSTDKDFIERLLMERYSKPTIMVIVEYVGSDAGRFSLLMDLMAGDDGPMAQRAAWVVNHSLDRHPQLAEGRMGEMLDLLKRDIHDAIHRCILRSWETIVLPEPYHGTIIDICFEILMDRKAAIALRVYAMTAIYRLSKRYPEIKPELDLVLNEEMPYGSAGFRNRGAKMLRGKYRLKTNSGE